MNGLPLVLGSGIAAPVAIPQVADTVLALPGRDGFDVIFGVTAGLIGLTFLAILLGILFLFFQARKVARAIESGRERLARDRGVEHLRRTAENIEKISRTFSDETERLRVAGAEVSARLTQVSDRMEERIEEFNALMEVIQDEAEEVFLDTASTARGMRRGLGRLAGGRQGSRMTRARRLARERLRADHREDAASSLPEAPGERSPEGEPGIGEDQLPDSQVTAPPGERPVPPPEGTEAEGHRP
jgi:hypothetical protein